MRSHNLGVDLMREMDADWLIILSAAVRFGAPGGLDYIAQLADTPYAVVPAQGVKGWHLIAFRREVVEAAGRWDENFTPYGYDDVDYSIRIWRALPDHVEGGVPVDLTDAGMGHSLRYGGVRMNNRRLLAYLQDEVGPPPRPRLQPSTSTARSTTTDNPVGYWPSINGGCMGQARPVHRPGPHPMRVPVLWCSRHDDILARGYADQGLSSKRCSTAPSGPHRMRSPSTTTRSAATSPTCPVRSWSSTAVPTPHSDDVKWFTGQLDRLEWAVVLLCGDEEWVFPWQQVPETERRKVWVMQARPEHAHLSGFLPGGWYPGTPEHLRNADPSDRSLDWFFAGQVNHARRKACIDQLHQLHGGILFTTPGYLREAVSRAEYFELMAKAKVIPCPSGPYSVDCARTFEALESGCIPIADTVTAHAGAFDYWELLFREEPPFPRIANWPDFPALMESQLADWPHRSNRVFAWWQQWKRRITRQLDADIRAVAGAPVTSNAPDDLITVIVTTSPAPLHPSIDHIRQTIESIRSDLPTAEIVIACDGVRPEQCHRTADYQEYIRRLLWTCNTEWSNVVPLVLDEWQHQALATRAALELVETPLILFMEHDTPIVGDIDWAGLCRATLGPDVDLIRLHQDVAIHPDHESVMHGGPLKVDTVTARRTAAWWQRPHLAKTSLYRDRVMPLFSDTSRTMIEDAIYPVVWVDFLVNGWGDWKLWIYTPPGDDIRRSGHLDSRGEDPKYGMWT